MEGQECSGRKGAKMSQWLWSRSDLLKLSGHKKPEVRRWACERMRVLYGEAGIEILERLLRDKERKVLLEALTYLDEYPNSRFKDTLLKIYQNRTGVVAGRCAFLLGKLKDERLISAFKRKVNTRETDFNEVHWSLYGLGELGSPQARAILRETLSEIEEDPDPYLLNSLIHALVHSGEELSFLLNCYARHYKRFAMELLHPLASVCGSWFSVKDLQEEGERKIFKKTLPRAVSESLSYLKKKNLSSLGESLGKAYKKQDYRQVIEVAWGYAKKRAEEAGIQGIELPLSKDDSHPLSHCKVLKGFNDFLDQVPKEALKEMAIVAIVILSGFVEFQSLLGLKIEELDEERLVRILFEDRGSVKIDHSLMERLLEVSRPERVYQSSIHQLKNHPHSFGTERAIQLLGKLNDERAIPELADYLGRKGGDEALDRSIKALAQMGEPFLDYLEKYFDELNSHQQMEILFSLKDLPMERTADLLLRHWDRLWSADKEPFLYALEGVASKRFIDPLRKELREGEVLEEEVFYLLCHIHRVDDILLPHIERDIAEREKDLEKELELFQREDGFPPLPETVSVELRCRQCGKPYHYEVRDIYLIGEKEEPRIGDRIVCKNCRAINQYEVTPKGRMTILSQMILTAALAGEEKGKPLEGPIKRAQTGLMDGRRMSLEEMLKYYQDEVRKFPEDPGLRVGYGNVLMKIGMEKEAVLQYQEAIRLDPLSVEAYASLGGYEGDKGRFSQAYEYFKKAAEVVDKGHYYRTNEVDQVKEAVFLNLEYFEDLLGIETKELSSSSSHSLVKREKVGRNDPCPCGSGKKYKKCCLIKEESRRAEKTSATPTEIGLRNKVLSFSTQERFKKDFEKAYRLFWRKPFKEPVVLDEEKEANFGAFLEWFVHDFVLKSGLTVLEEYCQEKKDRLSREELSLLNYEMASYLSLYEVVSVTPEVGLRLRDLVTQEEIDVSEVRGSLQLVKWDVIFARVIKMDSVNKLSGMVTVIPRSHKEKILSAVQETWAKAKEGATGMTWPDFMKANAHLVHHLIEDRSAKGPSFLTEEYHRVISSKAMYEVRDFRLVKYRLDKEFDFVLDKEEGENIQWAWLKRGKSKDWEEGTPVERSVIVTSEMVSGKGKLRWTSLGTVTLTPNKLELWSISKERLERGKKRLQEILGDCIHHRFDTFEDILKKATEKVSEASEPEEFEMPEEHVSLLSGVINEWYTNWIDEKIPALDGMTPREAVKTPEGREKVKELLKDFENVEEKKRRNGEPYVDINLLRQMLGL